MYLWIISKLVQKPLLLITVSSILDEDKARLHCMRVYVGQSTPSPSAWLCSWSHIAVSDQITIKFNQSVSKHEELRLNPSYIDAWGDWLAWCLGCDYFPSRGWQDGDQSTSRGRQQLLTTRPRLLVLSTHAHLHARSRSDRISKKFCSGREGTPAWSRKTK